MTPELEHIHLPSVHVRAKDGTGFDYEEDLYVGTRTEDQPVWRVIRFAILAAGEPISISETFDELCEEELAEMEELLPVLMDEGNPAAEALMRESARNEFERQLRIGAGEERACANCGCSETRACSGGCGWATETLCSNCADSVVEDAPLVELAQMRSDGLIDFTPPGLPESPEPLVSLVSDAEATRFLRARKAGA
jgi:hypothetical protein